MKATPENKLKEEIKVGLSATRQKATRWPGLRLFSNPRGTALMNYGNVIHGGLAFISYGLAPGSKEIASSDFIGWRTITITPEMVGHKLAQFVSIETKAPGKKATKEQQAWLDLVNTGGGLGHAIESTQQLDALLFAAAHQYGPDLPI